MRKYFIFVLLTSVIFIIIAGFIFYKWWNYGRFPTCKENCINAGYSDGGCIDYVTFESPETRCSSRGSSLISGEFSDCLKVPKDEIGVGVICCCK